MRVFHLYAHFTHKDKFPMREVSLHKWLQSDENYEKTFVESLYTHNYEVMDKNVHL